MKQRKCPTCKQPCTSKAKITIENKNNKTRIEACKGCANDVLIEIGAIKLQGEKIEELLKSEQK